jgi:glycosyltransferase involved in cell wall biosynthesis
MAKREEEIEIVRQGRGILFLSVMDFTDMGIQVVKLTPEYFARQRWNVHYVVARDNSRYGSYEYQPTINPEGITVHRVAMPSCWLGEQAGGRVGRAIYSQLRSYAAIIDLVWIGHKIIKNHEINVIYGCGPYGVLAAQLFKLLHFRRPLVVVSRFYGVWDLYTEVIKERRWLKFMINFAAIAALFISSNLKVITNDGTFGNKALSKIRRSNLKSLRFYVNGVEKYCISPSELIEVKNSLKIVTNYTGVCITRLIPPKRVDFCIKVAATVVVKYGMANFKLIVVGEGSERASLEKLSADLGVSEHVIFTGPVDNKHVRNYLSAADIFLSMYRVSNVGNPLLEAIRANIPIFTLNNGDTSAWIKHRENGFIYDEDETTVDRIAVDIVDLMTNVPLLKYVKQNIKATEEEMLWTWDERLRAEYEDIEGLLVRQIS